MSPARERNSCEILRSLGLVPNFITDRCCCSSQTSGFDVKSQTLQASESEHRGPVMLPITSELCVSSEVTVHAGGRGKGVRSFFLPVLKSMQTSLDSTGLPFARITKAMWVRLGQLGGLPPHSDQAVCGLKGMFVCAHESTLHERPVDPSVVCAAQHAGSSAQLRRNLRCPNCASVPQVVPEAVR